MLWVCLGVAIVAGAMASLLELFRFSLRSQPRLELRRNDLSAYICGTIFGLFSLAGLILALLIIFGVIG